MSEGNRRWITVWGGLVLAGSFLATGCPPPAPRTETQDDVPRLPDRPILSELNGVEQDVYWRINEIRRRNGLTPLVLKADLCRAAREHNQDMIRIGRTTHLSDDGKDIGRRLTDQNIGWNLCAENIAAMPSGDDLVSRAVAVWMDQPASQQDVLNHLYNETGLAAAQDPKTGRWFLTQIYARRTGYWVD